MIAYYFQSKKIGAEIIICESPCNGLAFQNSEKIKVSGKAEAKKICKERGIQPWNF